MENKALIFLFLLLFVPTTAAQPSGVGHLLIYEVSPYSYPGTHMDYVCVYNPLNVPVNLSEYILTDFEGNISLSGEIMPHSKIYIAENASSFFRFFGFYPNFTFTSLPHDGRFSLSNRGDEVALVNGKIVDMVVYGSSTYSGSGWHGAPVPVSKGHVLRRVSYADTDSAGDWSSFHRIAQSDFTTYSLSTSVELLTLPDDIGEIFRILNSAKKSIYIEMYTISSMKIADLLAEKAESGVNVRVLVEGMPVGGMKNSEKYALNYIVNHGVKVKVMANDLGAHNRYAYVHSKFLVIDNRTSLILTENFDSLSIAPAGNRGFGVIVKSEKVARYLLKVFRDDSKNVQDIREFSNFFYSSPGAVPVESRAPDFASLNITAAVSLVVAPDFSQDALRNFLDSQKWVDVEAMYLRDAPLEWAYPKARRILTWESVIGYGMRKFNAEKMHLRMLHGKMIIGDSGVILGSMNFGNFSMLNNREVSIVVHSPAAVKYYERVFNRDWLGLSRPVAVMHITKDGDKIKVDLTGSEGRISEYIVYVDGKEVYRGKNGIVTLAIQPGKHRITGLIHTSVGDSRITETIEYEPEAPDNRVFIVALIFAAFLYKLWKNHG